MSWKLPQPPRLQRPPLVRCGTNPDIPRYPRVVRNRILFSFNYLVRGMRRFSSSVLPLTAIFAALVALGGCSTDDPDALAQNDPLEPTNRAVFDFDVKLDHAVARP